MMVTPPIASSPCRLQNGSDMRRSLRGTCRRSCGKVLRRFGVLSAEFVSFPGAAHQPFVRPVDEEGRWQNQDVNGQSIREMDDWMTVQNQLDFYEVAEDILKQLRMIGDQATRHGVSNYSERPVGRNFLV
mmetsp:Transcript_37184/g.80058  ORF Transcript_37184/g.80058 Transcript_37184/m.80058 type:complete len:130 (+) Transcript_37184:125-514(+)